MVLTLVCHHYSPLGSPPGHTAVGTFFVNLHQPWNCMFWTWPICQRSRYPHHHPMRLSFSDDPGVRAPNDACALCIPFAAAAQRKLPAMPMRMRPKICFFPAEIRCQENKVSAESPILTRNTEYESLRNQPYLHLQNQDVRWRSAWTVGAFPPMFILLHRGSMPRSLGERSS